MRMLYFNPVPQSKRRALTNIKEQILKLLSPLYHSAVKFERPYDAQINGLTVKADTSQWEAIMADLKKHPVRWNPDDGRV